MIVSEIESGPLLCAGALLCRGMPRRKMKKRYVLLFAACLMLCLSQAGLAQGKTHRIVFAVTSGDEADWKMTVGNIRNLISGMKPDVVEVEVVAYSQGLNLVKQTSSLAADIVALQAMNVRFVACQNSMRMQHVELKDLLTGVEPVPSGIIEVVTKQEQGWAYIKGGR
jgi:intracellular sulfur oxidation DsrE/DsrF family protein